MTCIIDHKHKFVFCHIPRTGGSSFSEYIRNYCTARKNLGKENGEFIEVSHTPLWNIKKLYFRDPDHKWEEYFKFAIIRNPYDRLVSLFCHLVGRGNERWDGNFSNMMAELDNDAQWTEYNRFRYGQAVFWPAKTYLCDYDNPMFDDLVAFDNMQARTVEIAAKLGIRIPLADYDNKPSGYPHINRSDRKPYQSYYDDYCLGVVEKRYGQDFLLGGSG